MSCCGCIFRLLALVLLLCFTACAILSNVLPIFRSTTSLTGDATAQRTVYYWFQQLKVTLSDGSVSKLRTNIEDQQCDIQRHLSIAVCCLGVAASAFGALASLFTVFWMLPCCRCAMGVVVFLFTLLAGLCCAGIFGMMTWGFIHGFCTFSPVVAVAAYREDGYAAVEGYVLLCVAGLGFLVMALAEAVAYCCVRCCCGGASSRKPRSEGRSEPTREAYEKEAYEKEAPSDDRTNSDNAPYAMAKH